ncbi:hypothetical protein [Rufibacter roseolus]|uniref:hypothetical protein n=1 Tax=Rufibacter roseolus TaxID=2817375 RepID=UPI001B30557A|nr:hypothetical protein [Rufibacter roseolus]
MERHSACPEAMRFAWADNLEGANLYNKEGLRATPFKTDSQADTPKVGVVK